jgi:hypothetical protein
MRVLITGSRTWTDHDAIHTVLDAIAKEAFAAGDTEVVVVHGCASGADTLADLWVRRNAAQWPVRAERYPAQWKRYGKRAGMVRNARMVRLGADVCLAFIKDGSRGATSCADLAEDHSIRTERFIVRTDSPPDGA